MIGNAVVGSDRNAFALEYPRAAACFGFLSQKNKVEDFEQLAGIEQRP
jgi:hypothetical protein